MSARASDPPPAARLAVDQITLAIRSSCSRYVTDPHDLEDAVQDGWVALLETEGQLRDPAKVVAFAATVAGRQTLHMIDRAKSEKGRLVLFGAMEFTPGADECPILRQELEDDITNLVLRLPPQRRLALILWMHGSSFEEIAPCLGRKKIGTAKATVHQAQAQIEPWLRELLARYDKRDEPPKSWDPTMHQITRADLEEMIRQIEEFQGPLSQTEKAEILSP